VPHSPLHVLIDSTGLQVYGVGQWLEAKHAAKSRRKWRKLHLAVDAASGMIVAQTLTDQDTDEGTGSTDATRSPFGDDCRTRRPGLANCDRLRPMLLSRNDNGSLRVSYRARGLAGQQTEAAIGVAMLNRMLAAGRPDSVRRQPVVA
jgi:hypothetical protein